MSHRAPNCSKCRTFLSNSTFTTTWRTFLLAEEVWCTHINADLAWLFFFFFISTSSSGRSAEVGTVSSWILADGIMGIHSHQCVFYCINWYCWKYQANSQVCKPLLRSEIEAAIFRAKYKLRTNAQMLIRYVSIRPLFKGNVFGSCREERMGKRAENERHRKLKLNEAACHLGGGRGR